MDVSMPTSTGELVRIDTSRTELDGPFECSLCHGHNMLDMTFGEQVSRYVVCPYCESRVLVNGWREERL